MMWVGIVTLIQACTKRKVCLGGQSVQDFRAKLYEFLENQFNSANEKALLIRSRPKCLALVAAASY